MAQKKTVKRVKPSKPDKVDISAVKNAIMAKSTGNFSDKVEFLNTGCSMLNLAISGRINDGGWPRARVVNIVGDGSSGKTILALEMMAAAFYKFKTNNMIKTALFKKTKKLYLVYNNVEAVMDFNIVDMYGPKFYDSIDWISTGTIEEFGADFFTRLKNIKAGDTIIYIMDSWDSVDSKEDKEKFEKNIDKAIKGKQVDGGGYSLGKQRYASKNFFRKVCADVQSKGADMTLFIVSQVRDKIGVVFGKKQYRAGGKALDFYTHAVIWLQKMGKDDIQILGQKRTRSTSVKAKVERSKVWKSFRECEFKIVYDYGVDDIDSLMSFYFGPKVATCKWDKKEHKRKDLHELFRTNRQQFELLKISIQELWDEIEDKVAPKFRKYEDLY